MFVVAKWWLPLVSVVVPEVRNVVVICSGLRDVGFGVSLNASVGIDGMSFIVWIFAFFRDEQNFLYAEFSWC